MRQVGQLPRISAWCTVNKTLNVTSSWPSSLPSLLMMHGQTNIKHAKLLTVIIKDLKPAVGVAAPYSFSKFKKIPPCAFVGKCQYCEIKLSAHIVLKLGGYWVWSQSHGTAQWNDFSRSIWTRPRELLLTYQVSWCYTVIVNEQFAKHCTFLFVLVVM